MTARTADTGVYVNDSFEGAQAIANVSRLVAAERYREAAEQAQSVIESFGEKVGRDARTQTFVSLARLMERRMAAWPAKALAAYRKRYDQPARALFQRAWQGRRIDALLEVADRYFFTTWGYRAAQAAGQLAMESGDLPLAVELYRHRLPMYPSAATDRVDHLARVAVCAAWLGWSDVVREALDRLDRTAVETGISWPGLGRIAPDEFRRRVMALKPAGGSAAGPGWPVFGGDPSRSRLCPADLKQRAHLWSSKRYTSDVRLLAENFPRGRLRFVGPRADTTDLLCFAPVIGEDAVYFCDRWRVWAIDSFSGSDLWQYGRLPAEALLALASATWQVRPRPTFYSPTLNNGRVYAVLGGESVLNIRARRGPKIRSAMVCLDAATGKLLWRADSRSDKSLFEGLVLDTSPVVWHGRIYVVGRYPRAAKQGQSCHLLCFDAATGRALWQTQLASGDVDALRVAPSLVALGGDAAFVCTNVGVMAAVNPTTGRIRWLRVYRRRRPRQFGHIPLQFSVEGLLGTRAGWQVSPVLLWRGFAIAAPADDNQHAYLFDRSDGRLRTELAAPAGDTLACLLGLVADRLYALTGSGTVVAFALPTGKRIAESDRHEVRGLPLVTADGILLPTQGGPVLLGLDLQTRQYAYQWPEPDPPIGNTVGSSGLLVIATADRIHGFARKQAVRARLRQRIAQHPNDPGPYLALAQMLFRSSPGPGGAENGEGLAAVDKAIEVAGGYLAMDAATRHRIFRDCLAFVRMAAAAKPPRTELALALSRRAQQCIQDKDGHIQYRLSMAEIYERQGDWDRVIQHLHQIVFDAGLREVPIDSPEEDAPNKTVAAGDYARRRIESIIHDFGRKHYASVERRAERQLAAARAARDLDELTNLYQAYPNSYAADRALLAAAKILLAGHQPRQAATCLRRARASSRRKTGSPIDDAELLRLLAEAYLAQGRRDVAAWYLNRGRALHPDRTFTVAGRSYTFASYLAHLLPDGASPLLSTPRIGPPKRIEPIVRRFPLGTRLLEPEYDFESVGRRNQVVVYSDTGLMAYEVPKNEPIWDRPVSISVVPRLLMATDGLWIFHNGFQVMALDRRTGRRAWTVGKRPDPDRQDQDPEQLWTWSRWGASASMILGCKTRHGKDQRLYGIDVAAGKLLWQRPAPLDNADQSFELSDQWAAYRAYDPKGKGVAVLIDLATGKPGPTLPIAEDDSPAVLQFSPVGQLVVLTESEVACFDPDSGRRLWRRDAGGGFNTFFMRVGVDSVYSVVRDSGGDWVLQKRSLETGQSLWSSPARVPITANQDINSLQIDLHGDLCIVSNERFIVAFDTASGRKRWEAMMSGSERLVVRTIAEPYVVALDLRRRHDDTARWQYTAKLYDIGREGFYAAELDLGSHDPARRFLVRDDCLILEGRSQMQIWPCPAEKAARLPADED